LHYYVQYYHHHHKHHRHHHHFHHHRLINIIIITLILIINIISNTNQSLKPPFCGEGVQYSRAPSSYSSGEALFVHWLIRMFVLCEKKILA